VHQADIRVQRGSHHAVRGFAVTLRDRDCMLVVQAQDHLRVSIA
jgi:hypothetical protein